MSYAQNKGAGLEQNLITHTSGFTSICFIELLLDILGAKAELGAEMSGFDDTIFSTEDSLDVVCTVFAKYSILPFKKRFGKFLLTTSAGFKSLHFWQGAYSSAC
jgi:hypothetical protein